MSKIMESKQSAPSVIARLMGLEELNPQQPVQKRQRVLSENYLRRVASIGLREKHSFHAPHSFRQGSENQKECTDVLGVSETLKNEKLHLPPVLKRKVKSYSSEVNGTFMRQKSRYEKCVAADKKLQLSIDYCDAPEVLDSEMDISLQYFKGPDSLIATPLKDWKCVPSPSQSGHTPVSSSSTFSDFRETDVHRRLRRVGRRGYVKSNEKIKNGLSTGSNGEHGISNDGKFHRSPFEFANRRCIPTTRIVLLKPYPESPKNSGSQLYSSTATHAFQIGDRKHRDILNPESGNFFTKAEGRKNIADDRKFFRLRSSLSEESNRQREHSLSIMSAREPELETAGGATTEQEAGWNIPFSVFFSDWRNHYLPSYSGISCVAVEANEKILGRGTTAKYYKRIWASTGGKMLSMPDNKLRPILDGKPTKRGLSNQTCQEKGEVNLDFPFSISRSDAREDRLVRSTSPSVNSSENESSKSKFSLQRDRYIRPLESLNRVRQKPTKQELKDKHGMVLQHTGPRSVGSPPNSCFLPKLTENGVIHHSKNQLEDAYLFEQNSVRPRSSSSDNFCSYSEVDHAVQENLMTEEELEVTLKDKDQYDQNCVVPRSSLHDVASISLVPDILPDSENEAVGKSFLIVEQHHGSTERILEKYDSFSYAAEKSIQQDMPSGVFEEDSVYSCCSGTEFECVICLEDTYQPSPVSVLEPIFKNDISSCSESFQNGAADLQGLQMQLEILKSEMSDGYSEGSGMTVSSDEDTGEVISIGYSEENEDSFNEKSKREFSYLVDIFSEAGFQSSNPFVGSDKWNSPNCLIDRSVFETVEKKYGEQKSWKRSERRLLFDRINSGLMEMLHTRTGVLLWTKPVGRRFGFRHSPEMIMEELWRLLVSQEKQVFEELPEKVLGNDDGWLDLGDEVEVIGMEIENSLIDELAAEFVTMNHRL